MTAEGPTTVRRRVGAWIGSVLRGVWGSAILLTVLIAVAALVILGARREHVTALDAAAILLIAGSVAVGIERGIEFVWTVIGLVGNAFWPLNAVSKYVTNATKELDAAVDPIYKRATEGIEVLKDLWESAPEAATQLQTELSRAREALDGLKASAKGSSQVQVYAAAAADFVGSVQTRYGAIIATGLRVDPEQGAKRLARALGTATAVAKNPKATEPEKEAAATAEEQKLGRSVEGMSDEDKTKEYLAFIRLHEPATRMVQAGQAAGVALSGLGDLVASFSDNPGKRLLSLLLGALAGVVVAGVLGLDLFTAVLGTPDADGRLVATAWGVIFTGIVMGLGSSPTHEVVKALQEYKQRNKKATAPEGGALVAGSAATVPGTDLPAPATLGQRAGVTADADHAIGGESLRWAGGGGAARVTDLPGAGAFALVNPATGRVRYFLPRPPAPSAAGQSQQAPARSAGDPGLQQPVAPYLVKFR